MLVDYAIFRLQNLDIPRLIGGLCNNFMRWCGAEKELHDMHDMSDLIHSVYEGLVPNPTYPFGGFAQYEVEREFGNLYYNEARLDFLRRLSKLHDTFVDDFGNLRQKDVETLAGDFHEYH